MASDRYLRVRRSSIDQSRSKSVKWSTPAQHPRHPTLALANPAPSREPLGITRRFTTIRAGRGVCPGVVPNACPGYLRGFRRSALLLASPGDLKVAGAQTPPPDVSGRIISGSLPADGSFGLIVFGGGSFDQLVAATGCPAPQVTFWVTVSGAFLVDVPATSGVGAVNAPFEGAFPNRTIPLYTPFIGRCVPTAAQPQVTLSDNGRTMVMRVGDTFLLNLGGNYNWNVQVGDTSIVSRVVNIAVPPGAQGVYRANATGTTSLSATGSLPCANATPPCLAPALLFRATVVVQ